MTAPGWYPDGHGHTRYWDGVRWTEQVAPAQVNQGQQMGGYPTGAPPIAQPPGYWQQQAYSPTGYGVPPGYELKRKRRFYQRVWFWLIIVPAIFLIVIVVAISVAVNKAVNNRHTVVYSVTGGGTTADVTYLNVNGDGTSGEEQDANAALPWTKTVQGKGDFSEYSLVAQASNGASISCSITVDGKVEAQQTSTGDFALVSCAASGSS